MAIGLNWIHWAAESAESSHSAAKVGSPCTIFDRYQSTRLQNVLLKGCGEERDVQMQMLWSGARRPRRGPTPHSRLILIAAAAISGFAAVLLFVKEPTFYYAVGLGLALGCVTYLATHPQLHAWRSDHWR
jgi:hypothetical protein